MCTMPGSIRDPAHPTGCWGAFVKERRLLGNTGSLQGDSWSNHTRGEARLLAATRDPRAEQGNQRSLRCWPGRVTAQSPGARDTHANVDRRVAQGDSPRAGPGGREEGRGWTCGGMGRRKPVPVPGHSERLRALCYHGGLKGVSTRVHPRDTGLRGSSGSVPAVRGYKRGPRTGIPSACPSPACLSSASVSIPVSTSLLLSLSLNVCLPPSWVTGSREATS